MVDTEKQQLTSDQYKALSKSAEKIGLLTLAGVVAQKIVSGATLIDPVVVGGFFVAVFMYAIHIRFLLKA